MMIRENSLSRALYCLGFVFVGVLGSAAEFELIVEAPESSESIDLTRYSLGQGGLSDSPMFEQHVEQIAQLKPQTIRLFVQEYFNIYPDHRTNYWETLDKAIEVIRATKAKPILSLCFKPLTLFPKIDQDVVHPNSYKEWGELITALVKHCNDEQSFGIEYWEIGNEPDIGEDGGCPYRFQPKDYLRYYTQTAQAIRKADPSAKIGGPALANYKNPIGDALLEHCNAGRAPLHFFSWHAYNNDPNYLRQSIQDVREKIARYPKLKGVETILDEWNMSLDRPVLLPAFQPAFILETTSAFYEEGLSRSAYYHIRDYFVDPVNFWFMSRKGREFMAHWWNVMPQYDGLYDHQGQVRPAYYAFKLLSLIRGDKLAIKGTTADIKGFAAQRSKWSQVVVWNFPQKGSGEEASVTIRFPFAEKGSFRVMKLNSERAINHLEILQRGNVADLEKNPMRFQMAPYDIRWIEITQ
jgi:xylan 1,4-beta-xylosidase